MRKAGILLLAAVAMSGAFDQYNSNITNDEPEKLTDEEKKQIKEKQNLAKGLKKFIIQGKEIWAMNEKTAIKKYKKQL